MHRIVIQRINILLLGAFVPFLPILWLINFKRNKAAAMVRERYFHFFWGPNKEGQNEQSSFFAYKIREPNFLKNLTCINLVFLSVELFILYTVFF